MKLVFILGVFELMIETFNTSRRLFLFFIPVDELVGNSK